MSLNIIVGFKYNEVLERLFFVIENLKISSLRLKGEKYCYYFICELFKDVVFLF